MYIYGLYLYVCVCRRVCTSTVCTWRERAGTGVTRASPSLSPRCCSARYRSYTCTRCRRPARTPVSTSVPSTRSRSAPISPSSRSYCYGVSSVPITGSCAEWQRSATSSRQPHAGWQPPGGHLVGTCRLRAVPDGCISHLESTPSGHNIETLRLK